MIAHRAPKIDSKRGIQNMALCDKMTYKDKAPYASSPPCRQQNGHFVKTWLFATKWPLNMALCDKMTPYKDKAPYRPRHPVDVFLA